jgi:hypothetical protein
MNTIRIRKTLEKDGEIVLTGLPLKKGQTVEITVLGDLDMDTETRGMTASDLLNSGLVGMWADHDDIGDSVEFARKLREEAQRRTAKTDLQGPEQE